MRTEMDMMISGIAPLERPEAKGGVGKAGETSFTETLGKAVGELDKLQGEADQQARLVADGAGNLHEVAISLEKADVAMRLAMKVRNKIVDAYNEIMRMGV
jgi:flagellar hook-basal body complex protein FliE